MDIKKLQNYAQNHAMSPALLNRIMNNELTISDVNFLERGITAKALIEIRMISESMLDALQNTALELNERKNEESIEYASRLIGWMIDNIRPIHDLCEDIGLTDIEIKPST